MGLGFRNLGPDSLRKHWLACQALPFGPLSSGFDERPKGYNNYFAREPRESPTEKGVALCYHECINVMLTLASGLVMIALLHFCSRGGRHSDSYILQPETLCKNSKTHTRHPKPELYILVFKVGDVGFRCLVCRGLEF